jgi:hypothetical protein
VKISLKVEFNKHVVWLLLIEERMNIKEIIGEKMFLALLIKTLQCWCNTIKQHTITEEHNKKVSFSAPTTLFFVVQTQCIISTLECVVKLFDEMPN